MADEDELAAVRSKLVSQIARRAEIVVEQSVTSENREASGPPERTEADFAHILHWGSRQMALKEYQRTRQEFHLTGEVQRKTAKDFAHLVHPWDLADHVLAGHMRAASDIAQWKRKQWKEQEEARLRREADEARERSEEKRALWMREMAAGLPDQDQDFEDEEDDRAKRPLQAVPAPVPEQPKAVGLLRGIAFDPDLPSRNARFEPAIPLLDIAPVPERLPALDDQTETLLNAMIGECHFLMRAVAFPSLCHARVAEDRLNWVERAMDLAKTGATVAKAVARLRHGPSIRESHQKITVENKVAVVQGGGGCANP